MKTTVAIALLAVVALTGCAAPVAVQVASFAADGVAYMTTGKGTTDHALSTVAGSDCRLSNMLKGRDVCTERKPAAQPGADQTVVAALVAPTAADLATLGAIAPASGGTPRSTVEVSMSQSAGMNLVEIAGAPVDAVLSGRVDGDGTLHVFLHAPGAAPSGRALFTVPGYARRPGGFTGIVIGSRFVTPEAIIR